MDEIANPAPDSIEEKQQLELQKLKVDIIYTKRGFFAQLLNTATIAIAAGVVLYFFQRPQIDQLEMTRLATEKQQSASLVLSALSLQNEKDRTAMLETLARIYPQYEYISSISKSNILLAEKPPMKVDNPSASSAQPSSELCRELKGRWGQLKESYLELVNSAFREEAGASGTSRSGKQGRGPVWNSIIKQSETTQAEIDILEKKMKDAKCKD